MKKLLHLAISNSDKFDTYEIRQSFKVKRVDRASPAKTAIEPISSFDDSGMGGSNGNSFDECNNGNSEIPEHGRCNRALSMISESPEVNSQFIDRAPRSPVKHSRGETIDGNSETTLHNIDKKASINVTRPEFLDLPFNRGKMSYISKRSYTEEHSCSTTTSESLPSPFLQVQTPTQCFDRDTAGTHQNSGVLCAEPIVINCDGKSEYFRLVVKRTVRDCSDSESDAEDRGAGLNIANKLFMPGKQKIKSKIKGACVEGKETPFCGEQSQKGPPGTQDGKPNFFTNGETLERATKVRRTNHQRSPSGLSNSSVGLTIENDDIQIEISNTHRHSKRMQRLVQFSQNSLQRTQKISRKQTPTEDPVQTSNKNESIGAIEKQLTTNLVKDIWDGTLRRFRSKRAKLFKQDRNLDIQSTQQLQRQLSQSMSNVSKPTATSIKVKHQRSRSAFAANETYTADNPSSSSVNVMDKSVKIATGRHKTSLELQLNVNNGLSNQQPQREMAAATHHSYKSASTQQKSIHLSSWSHSYDEGNISWDATPTRDEKQTININIENDRENSVESPQPFKPQPHIEQKSRERVIHVRSVSNPHTPLDPESYAEVTEKLKANIQHAHCGQYKAHVPKYTNEVMLPVKLRLPGGAEQEMCLTKQELYGHYQKAKKRSKSMEVTVKRKRSMSQPNLSGRHLGR